MDIQKLTNTLQRLTSGEAKLTQEDVSESMRVYPYFSLPLLLYIRQADKPEKELIDKASVYTPDIELLAQYIGVNEDFSDLYPAVDTPVADDTDSAIDLFLHTYSSDEGNEVPPALADFASRAENTPDEEQLYIPAYDYMSVVQAMPDAQDATPLDGEEMLSRFIDDDAAGKPMFSKAPDAVSGSGVGAEQAPLPESNEPLFTESLAKIYIRQRRYAKALEIIRKLSLNNPEKNAYFADQIRFLEKLIINVKK